MARFNLSNIERDVKEEMWDNEEATGTLTKMPSGEKVTGMDAFHTLSGERQIGFEAGFGSGYKAALARVRAELISKGIDLE